MGKILQYDKLFCGNKKNIIYRPGPVPYIHVIGPFGGVGSGGGDGKLEIYVIRLLICFKQKQLFYA